MKKLAELKQGAYFFCGGVQWVVLENDDKTDATLVIAAEPVIKSDVRRREPERLARFVLAPGVERPVL